MSATAIRRTGTPIRRHSRTYGRCELAFWRRFDPRDVSRFMLAAERLERTQREPGKRNGPLGPVGVEVLRELLRLIDYRTGRLEPSIAGLMARLRRSRDAIVRALANLRAAGFLDWLRRWEPTGAKEGEGPAIRQATNAYRLMLPPAALKLIGRLGEAAPPPVDDEDRRAAQIEAGRAMIEALPLWEQGSASTTDKRLAAVLNRLGAAVAGCESAKRTESPKQNYINGVGLVARHIEPKKGR